MCLFVQKHVEIFSNKKSVSVSKGCGPFAEHHWHCLGEHCGVLLCNPDSQRGSKHSRGTAAYFSPPGGQSSEGGCFLQLMRQAESARYKQSPSVTAIISPFVYFHTRYKSSKFWTVFCVPSSCLFFCIRVNKHILLVLSKYQKFGRERILVFLFCCHAWLLERSLLEVFKGSCGVGITSRSLHPKHVLQPCELSL